MITKKVYLHKNDKHEVYYVDSMGRKQGLYTILSRKTKKKKYECFYLNNQKVGIESHFDQNGNLTHSDSFLN
jgi:hypothetical protein